MFNVQFEIIYTSGQIYRDTVPYDSIKEAEKEIQIFDADYDPFDTGVPIIMKSVMREY